MTVEHSLLTGSSLHEPKGVDSASSGQVYIADGLGSGAWTGTGSFNAFGNALLHVRDQRTSGSAGQSFAGAATWETKTLQTTLENEITGASLASSVMSLPSGEYYIEAVIPVIAKSLNNSTNRGQLRLRNTTASSTLIAGHSMKCIVSSTDPPGNHQIETSTYFTLRGRFTLGSTSNVEVQVHTSTTTTWSQEASATGEVENYGDVLIWKVA
jgi:hypothetical protein